MKFVPSDRGMVNLDHVASLEEIPMPKAAAPGGMRQRPRYRARAANDDVLGIVDGFDVEDLSYTIPLAIVPDMTGAVVVVAWFDAADTWTRRLPIIAWHVHEQYATPVTCEDLPEVNRTNGGWFIELPEAYGPARWTDPSNQDFTTFDDAVAALRARWEEAESRPAP
jgi:hypothetical protein